MSIESERIAHKKRRIVHSTPDWLHGYVGTTAIRNLQFGDQGSNQLRICLETGSFPGSRCKDLLSQLWRKLRPTVAVRHQTAYRPQRWAAVLRRRAEMTDIKSRNLGFFIGKTFGLGVNGVRCETCGAHNPSTLKGARSNLGPRSNARCASTRPIEGPPAVNPI